ncbi:MAG: four helix bundle protein [Rickettsiales bacterium]|jgi:four helix bundle protein|nr:four helix bundle protein [Rickettsiales bacterium]
MKSVEDLNVYKLGFKVALDVYKITEKFPKAEVFGLVSQMRRAAISINSNLSEGCARNSSGEYKHFAGISKGSAEELKFQVKISQALNYINYEEAAKLIEDINEICKMLTGLIKTLN